MVSSAKFESPSFTKKSPFVKKKATSQSSLFTKEGLIELYEYIQKVDKGLKLGEYEPKLAINIIAEKILE